MKIQEWSPTESSLVRNFDEDALQELADSINNLDFCSLFRYRTEKSIMRLCRGAQMAGCKNGGIKRDSCNYPQLYRSGDC